MAILEALLPEDAVFGIEPRRVGPVKAEDFERWEQDPDNPVELVEGWLVPMSPGSLRAGTLMGELFALLAPLAAERGWTLSLDARHRLPFPPETVVFPDLVIHTTQAVPYLPGTETVARVPELVIEILGSETASRDRAPRGAKFLAYQGSGVAEYFHTFPDGSEQAGFRLEEGVFRPLESGPGGFFSSRVLGTGLRLLSPALQR